MTPSTAKIGGSGKPSGSLNIEEARPAIRSTTAQVTTPHAPTMMLNGIRRYSHHLMMANESRESSTRAKSLQVKTVRVNATASIEIRLAFELTRVRKRAKPAVALRGAAKG